MEPIIVNGWWVCEGCKEALGYRTHLGRLWLDVDRCALVERFWNMIRVRCQCGVTNRWYLDHNKIRQMLDDLEK
jgi:hypothetical protein